MYRLRNEKNGYLNQNRIEKKMVLNQTGINISVFQPVLKIKNRFILSEFIFLPKRKSKIFILNICLFDLGSKTVDHWILGFFDLLIDF